MGRFSSSISLCANLSPTASILQSLFSRDETELARFGNAADLNKAIIVANQFDAIVANVTPEKSGVSGSPLKGLEDIRRELSQYTRQPVPLYLTSASVARAAQSLLEKQAKTTAYGANASRWAMPAYNFYLEGLSNLLASLEGQPTPDYLEFIRERQSAIEEKLYPRRETGPTPAEARGSSAAGDNQGDNSSSSDMNGGGVNVNLAVTNPTVNSSHPETREAREECEKARLILELSGLPRLAAKIQAALESGSILRGRVANAEYYYNRVVNETALGYARHMAPFKLGLAEFAQPASNQASRLFLKFQHETRQQVEQLEEELRREWFEVSRRYIFGPHTAEVEKARKTFLETIQQVVMENRQLIQLEQHISTGQLVTDAWRKVFEDVNDWLALEAGRQMRSLVGPALQDIERLAGSLQKQLSELAAFPLDDTFWSNYRQRLAALNRRLQDQAETLALSFYTDNRFSVYDVKVAETLHVGDAYRRREEIIRLLQEQVLGWFNQMYQLVARVSMTNLNSFVNDLRFYVLGLPANNSLLVGLELVRPGSGQLSPDDSLISLLNLRYQTDESFRRQYALREPSPAERLALEIRGWLELIHPPLDGLAELGKAVTIAISNLPLEAEAGETGAETAGANQPPGAAGKGWPPPDQDQSQAKANAAYGGLGREINWLRMPVETRHPFPSVAKQYWELNNPDEQAEATRLHFSRIDLGSNSPANARIVLESLGRKKTQVIGGQERDFWSEPLPGRLITVRFLADNAAEGWGFRRDGFQSVNLAGTALTSK